MFRLELLENGGASADAMRVRMAAGRNCGEDCMNASIIKVYKQAFKMLKRSLRRENLKPCIVFNLRHQLIQSRESSMAGFADYEGSPVYIVF